MPQSFVSWAGLGLFCMGFFFFIFHWWDIPLNIVQRKWRLLIFLFVLLVPFNLFGGLASKPFEGDSIIGGLAPGMVFSAIPWLLISAFFGPVVGGMAGMLSGLFQATWLTHSLFTPFIIAISATLAGVSFRQKYRGGIYDALRHPWGASAIAAVAAYMLSAIAAFVSKDASLALRINASLSTWRADFLPIILPLVVAGIFGEFLYSRNFGPWRKNSNLLPSPDEGFSDGKFWRISLPVCVIFVFLFSQANWSIQTRQLNNFLQDSITSHADLASEYWSDELQFMTGRGEGFANQSLLGLSPLEFFLTAQKEFQNENVQISLISPRAMVINQYPDPEASVRYSSEVVQAIKSALSGKASHALSTHIGFEYPVLNLISVLPLPASEEGPSGAVLIQQGSYPRPDESKFWKEVTAIEELGGVVWVVPANDPQASLGELDPSEIQSRVFPGEFVGYQRENNISQFGYWPASENWNIFIEFSANAASQSLLPEFLKQTLLLITGFAIILLLLNLYWANLFRDEQRLLQATRQISRGDYSHLSSTKDVSELNELAVAMEQIRVSIKSQMDEAERLISIGRGVAFKEEFGTAVEPILRAALRGDAVCARVILLPPQAESVIQIPPRRLGLGDRSDAYAVLDNQILEICKREGIFVIRNTARSRRIDLNNAVTIPSSIVGLPIHIDKDEFLGVFWIGYDRPQIFPEEEVSHLKTLASEIAVAAAGERRFSETEQGKKQFEALLGAIQDPLILLESSGEVIFANDTAVNLEGLLLTDEEGNRVAAIPSLRKNITHGSFDEGDNGFITEIELPDGRIYSTRITPFKADGQYSGALCVMRDVNSYAEMIARKGEFVETVSHDLRQPLAMISGYATMIQMVGTVNEQQNGYLQKITNGLETINKMVNSILDLGRIETDTRLRLEEVSAKDLLEQIVDEMTPQANQKKITLSNLSTSIQDPILFEADAELMHQALFNVVENAIKFTNIDGKVDVWVEKIENHCIFHIQDNGIGISPIDLPKIFNKSSRTSNRNAGQRASKLGLTIVKSIVELHGGEVMVESQLGKGSHFRIEIPIG